MVKSIVKHKSTEVAALVPLKEFKVDGYQPRVIELRYKSEPIKKLAESVAGLMAINQTVDEIIVFVGVKNNYSEKRITTIANWLIDGYGQLNLLEVVEAFKLASRQELMVVDNHGNETPVQADTFNSFSIIYAGKILTAYVKHRQRETKRWSDATAAKRLPQGKPVVIPTHKQFGTICRMAYRGTFLEVGPNWKAVYQFMEHEGFISLTDAEKLEILNQVTEFIKIEENAASPARVKVDPAKAKHESRKRLIYAWLKNRYPQANFILNTPIHLPKINLKTR